MSLIPGIAKVLGVEIGEEFRITNDLGFRFKFTSEALLLQNEDEEDWYGADNEVIIALIKGEKEIIKLPFEPKYDEVYWTYVNRSFIVTEDIWQDMCIDWARKNAGVVFRTSKEAIAARPARYKALTGKEWQNDY